MKVLIVSRSISFILLFSIWFFASPSWSRSDVEETRVIGFKPGLPQAGQNAFDYAQDRNLSQLNHSMMQQAAASAEQRRAAADQVRLNSLGSCMAKKSLEFRGCRLDNSYLNISLLDDCEGLLHGSSVTLSVGTKYLRAEYKFEGSASYIPCRDRANAILFLGDNWCTDTRDIEMLYCRALYE